MHRNSAEGVKKIKGGFSFYSFCHLQQGVSRTREEKKLLLIYRSTLEVFFFYLVKYMDGVSIFFNALKKDEIGWNDNTQFSGRLVLIP